MRVIVCENYEEMSDRAAEIVASQIVLKPDCTLGLATGSTPIGLYKRLIDMNVKGELDFAEVRSFNLDEYYPIKRTNDQSYYYFMQQNLFSKINIKPENTNIPNGEAADPNAECKAYEKKIHDNGGIDLQILGIGKNGHIGFNEPDAALCADTHLTKLTDSTIKANSRFFERYEDVPKQALTMGIASILKARKIILLASGAEKSHVVSELLRGAITTDVPASMLMTHPDVVLICDKAAYTGSRLGVDIGGTSIKFAVVDDGKILYKSSIVTADTTEKILDDIVAECGRICKEHPINTVGVGTPGRIEQGLVYAVNLPFKNVPLEKELSGRLGLPVTVDNDANCAALGEARFGKGQECDNIIMITLGTGVGGGIIMDKQICHGNYSLGEIGHIIIQADGGLPCPCGLTGCFEQYASATALVREAEKAADANPDSILAKKREANGGKLNGREVFMAFEEGCKVAYDVLDNYARYLAIGIDSLTNIFGPDAIVLAGGITVQGDDLLGLLKNKVHTDRPVFISELQNDAGALGAAML